MKVVAKVGQVMLVVEGIDLSRKAIKSLLMDVAGIAASLAEDEPERPPIGFSAQVERADDPPVESFFTDDDPE